MRDSNPKPFVCAHFIKMLDCHKCWKKQQNIVGDRLKKRKKHEIFKIQNKSTDISKDIDMSI